MGAVEPWSTLERISSYSFVSSKLNILTNVFSTSIACSSIVWTSSSSSTSSNSFVDFLRAITISLRRSLWAAWWMTHTRVYSWTLFIKIARSSNGISGNVEVSSSGCVESCWCSWFPDVPRADPGTGEAVPSPSTSSGVSSSFSGFVLGLTRGIRIRMIALSGRSRIEGWTLPSSSVVAWGGVTNLTLVMKPSSFLGGISAV